MSNCHWDGSDWHKVTIRWMLAAHTEAAERGFPEAQNELGVRFYVGDCVERNRATALDWFGKATAQGNADACYNLGICYAYGQPSEINYAVAVDYFRWAVNLGSVEAASVLVGLHASGKMAGKDSSEVAKWYRMACRRDPKAMEFKRPASSKYQDDPERFAGSCHWLDIAADAGIKEAQYFKARTDYISVSYQRSFKSNARFAEDFDRLAREAVALFRSSSESGFVPSLHCLGDCYRTAFGVEMNITEAVRLYRLAAEKGYAPAQNALADIYFEGAAGEKNLQKAIELYKEAAAQGNAEAQYSLGMCYFNGLGVEKDLGKAWALLTRAAHGRVEKAYEPHWAVEKLVTPQERAKWDEGRRMNPFSKLVSDEEWRKWLFNNNYPVGYVDSGSQQYDWRKMAADLGNAKALCDIGVDLVENPTQDEDWVLAFKWFTRAADLGEPSAFFNVGKCLMEGIGTDVDKARALSWFEKARDSGYKSVEPFLADWYLDGIGCESDAEKAIAIYKRNMIPPGDRPRQAFLGLKCSQSKDGGISYHFSPARRWIRLMAESGDAQSQYSLGRDCARLSSGKPKENQEAFSWFLKAAGQGHAEAQNEVGECYRDGHGVEPDMSEAVRWFEKAAGQNNPRALFNLGFYYYAGNGVRRDWKKARELLERAVESDKDGWRAGDKAKECLRNMGVEVQSCRSQEQVTMKPDENEGVSCSGRDGPPSALAPPDSTRPDGKPWLTKAQILDLLEQTLCLRDKARVQRTSPEDADNCMLCWLAQILRNEIAPFDHWETIPGEQDGFPIYRQNPHFPRESVKRPCSGRRCDDRAWGMFSGLDDWMPPDGCYDLALEYWNRITQETWIDIPPEPPFQQFQVSEGFARCEKHPFGVVAVTFFPPAIRHFEWHHRYAGLEMKEWLAEVYRRNGGVRVFNCRGLKASDGAEMVDDGPQFEGPAWAVSFRHEDGREESFPGRFFPCSMNWKLRRNAEWMDMARRMKLWLVCEETGNLDNDEGRRRRFHNWIAKIERHVKRGGPEPEDVIDLDVEIPPEESSRIEAVLNVAIKGLSQRYLNELFPNSAPSEERK